MVASADNANRVSQAAAPPLAQAPTDSQRGSLYMGPGGKSPIKPGGAKDTSGSLPDVQKKSGPNTATTAPVKIDFSKIDEALNGNGNLEAAIHLELGSDRLPESLSSLPLIEDAGIRIINHYRDLKDSGQITLYQFAQVYDEVYNKLQSTTEYYIHFSAPTHDPREISTPPASLIIKKSVEFLFKKRFSDQDENGTNQRKLNERRYYGIKAFITNELMIDFKQEPKGPLLKTYLLECKKKMGVDHTHKDNVADMAKYLKGFGNQYIKEADRNTMNEAISEFKKAAGL